MNRVGLLISASRINLTKLQDRPPGSHCPIHPHARSLKGKYQEPGVKCCTGQGMRDTCAIRWTTHSDCFACGLVVVAAAMEKSTPVSFRTHNKTLLGRLARRTMLLSVDRCSRPRTRKDGAGQPDGHSKKASSSSSSSPSWQGRKAMNQTSETSLVPVPFGAMAPTTRFFLAFGALTPSLVPLARMLLVHV
jgi:hypothetical protein